MTRTTTPLDPRCRRPSPIALMLTALMITPLLAPLATADPGLDRRRDAMLDEMADQLKTWKNNPARARGPEQREAARPGPADAGAHASRARATGGAGLPPPTEPPAAEALPPPTELPPADPLPDPIEAAPAEPLPAPPPARRPTDDTPPAKPAALDPDAPLSIGRHDARAVAAAVLAETNAARAAHGLPPLEAHPTLDRAAIEYAGHMARTGHFGHIDPSRPGLENPGDRVRAAGAEDALAAENLITETWLQIDSGEKMFVVDESRHQFSRTPDGSLIPPHSTRTLAASMVSRWMKSPGHRRNILDVEARQMGFGMAWETRGGVPSLVAVQLFQRYHRLGEGGR